MYFHPDETVVLLGSRHAAVASVTFTPTQASRMAEVELRRLGLAPTTARQWGRWSNRWDDQRHFRVWDGQVNYGHVRSIYPRWTRWTAIMFVDGIDWLMAVFPWHPGRRQRLGPHILASSDYSAGDAGAGMNG